MRRCTFPAALLIAASSVLAYAQDAAPAAVKARESQGMPARATPGDYPSQMHVGAVTIAVQFTGHSVPKPDGPLSTEDYVVVEAGFFGPADSHISLSRNDFSIRINGKKKPFPSEPYELVDRSLKDPEWAPPKSPDSEEKSKSSFGTGGQAQDKTPVIVHVPIELQRAMAQYVEKSALPEGERPLPKAGLLFFPYRGPAKGIHAIQLVYTGSLGNATVDLQP